MQTALVILIVAVAAIYVGRVFYKGFKQKQNCACGCSCCGIADTCSALPEGHSRENTSDQTNP
jgi:hypothetical protein